MTLLTSLGVEEKRGETMVVRGLAATQARERKSLRTQHSSICRMSGVW